MLVFLLILLLQVLDLVLHLLLSFDCLLLLLLLLQLVWIQSFYWPFLSLLSFQSRDCFLSLLQFFCLLLVLLAHRVILIFKTFLINTHLLHIQQHHIDLLLAFAHHGFILDDNAAVFSGKTINLRVGSLCQFHAGLGLLIVSGQILEGFTIKFQFFLCFLQ